MDSTDRRSSAEIFQDNLVTVYRIAYTFLGSGAEAEEASRRAFASYYGYHDSDDALQERSSLIVKVTEACFSLLGRGRAAGDEASGEAVRAMVALPEKLKTTAYLFFCEGLMAREIAVVLEDRTPAVTGMIDKARRQLRAKLGGDFEDEGLIREAYERLGPDIAAAERIWNSIHASDGDGAYAEPAGDESGWVSYGAPAGAESRSAEPEPDYAESREAEAPRRSRAPREPAASSEPKHVASRRELREREQGFFDKLPKPALIAGAAVILVLFIVLAISFFGKKDKSDQPLRDATDFVAPGEADSADLSQTLAYQAPDTVMQRLDAVQAALKEWREYKDAKTQTYFAEKLPTAGPFLTASAAYDGINVQRNDENSYTLLRWNYMEDWGNTSISPITGQSVPDLVQQVDESSSVTVDKAEYDNYMAYLELQAQGGYGDYSYIYSVTDEQEAAKLEEIAAKYSLKLRSSREDILGFGEVSDAEMLSTLSQAVGKGDIYTAAPQFDHFCCYENNAFLSMADIALPDGRRMYTALCSTAYDEMVDGREVGGFTVAKPEAMTTRSYTAADGTALSISQSDTQAIIYAYLDSYYVVTDMSIAPWRQNPAAGDAPETLAAKRETDFAITDELVNLVADSINYKNIGK